MIIDLKLNETKAKPLRCALCAKGVDRWYLHPSWIPRGSNTCRFNTDINTCMKEFYANDLGFKVKAKNGQFVDFVGVAYMGDTEIYDVRFSNRRTVSCSASHKFWTNKDFVPAKELRVGDRVFRADGRLTKVVSVTPTGRIEPVYDLIEAAQGHRYVTNGVISHQCDFVSDDETLINPLTLSYMKGEQPMFYTDAARWYSEPEPNCIYLVGLDPAQGTQGDPAAIQIFKVPGMVQVAEWQSNAANTREQMRMLLRMLWFIDDELRNHPDQIGDPEIYWTVENNTIGESNLMLIEDIGEHNFPGTLINERRRRGSSKRFRKGLNTNTQSKSAACAQFKNLIEGDRMTVVSENLVIEMKNFVRAGSSYKAKGGMHDDLVMATMLAVRMLQTIRGQGVEVGEDLSAAFSEEEIFGEAMPIVM
jgi:hypothetical protein